MELAPYQEKAIDFGVEAGRFVLALPIGGRKTATTLLWAQRLGAQRTLIVAPTQVQGHWAAQAETWFPELRVINGRGTPAFRSSQRGIVRFGQLSATSPVALVVGYETMRSDVNALLACGFDTVIADEAHRLKDPGALQTKALNKLSGRSRFCALLTGSPILNAAHELWSLLHICAPKEFRSFWRWAAQHFTIETPTYGYDMRPVKKVGAMLPGHEEQIREEARRYLVQFDIDVLPDQPVETVLPIDLSAAERRVYDSVMKKGWAQLHGEDGDVLITPNAVSMTTRARQLASDWGSIDSEMPTGSKVAAAIELIGDLAPNPVVVMTAFRESAQRVAEATGGVTYLGGMSEADRQEAIRLFREGYAKTFCATIGAAGEGLDGLQHVSRDIIMLDRLWTPAANAQAIGRLQRSGQTGLVRVWHIAARNTTDEVVAQANVDKIDVIEALSLAGMV